MYSTKMCVHMYVCPIYYYIYWATYECMCITYVHVMYARKCVYYIAYDLVLI